MYSVPSALAAYRALTRLGLAVLTDGGILFQASCSSRISPDAFAAAVTDEADRQGVALVEVACWGHGLDHPVGFPEGSYLKAIQARAMRMPASSCTTSMTCATGVPKE